MVDNDIKVGNMANENLIDKDLKAQARKEAAAKRSLRKKKKKHLKLQKKHPILSILVYLVTAFLICSFIFLGVFAFVGHFFDDRVESESNTVNFMSDQYNLSISNGSEDVYQYLDTFKRDYIIVDNNKNIIREVGNNTCDLTSSGYYTGIVTNPGNIVVYPNRNNKFLTIHHDGSTFINIFKYWNTINDQGIYVGADDDNPDLIEEEFGVEVSDDGMISAPFWISKELNDGNQLIVKSYISANRSDINLLYIGFMSISIVNILIFITGISLIIRNIHDYRKMTKLLFLDYISDNHNWLWYKIKGEEKLRRNANATKKYAVITLIIVGYRNFVLCHSVEEGEELLINMYNTLQKSLIKKKELAAHSTANHFPLLLEYKDEASLRSRLKSIFKRLENIDKDHKFAFQAGVNVIDIYKNKAGLVMGRKNIDLDLEYNNACAAQMTMENSQDSGIAFFGDEIREKRQWIDKIIEHRVHAIDNEEFIVYYQPKYNPRTDELSGAEALIRWNSPDLGFVSPGRFIPVFEDDGFITEIDHYMLTHVAKDQRRWLDAGYDCVPVSVNVSRAHFGETDLADQIRDVVDKEGTPHHLIELELTESAFFDNQQLMIDTIVKLKSYGFLVAMDDFGSGYSSLNSLKDMPLDVLKLDAGFFRDITDNERSEKVVAEAIRLAKSLDMKTVAEGVEEKDQVVFLASEGCDMIQGYYYAKPMPGEEYEQRMAKASENEYIEDWERIDEVDEETDNEVSSDDAPVINEASVTDEDAEPAAVAETAENTVTDTEESDVTSSEETTEEKSELPSSETDDTSEDAESEDS